MDHTWGVADHTFLRWFVVAATFVMVAAMAYRAIAFRGHHVVSDDVDTPQVAFLAGGPRLAVYSSLGELRGAAAVGVNTDRVLTQTAPLPVDATQLDVAVHEAIADRLTAARLSGHPTVSATLARIRDDLEQAGLLLLPSQLSRTRWFVYVELAVVATGVARVAAYLVDGKPVGDLLSAFVLIGLYLLFMTAAPTRTRTGAAVLAKLRRRHARLAPPRIPSLLTDGPGAAALGIGLFGLDSLRVLDPVFYSDIGAPRRIRTVFLLGG